MNKSILMKFAIESRNTLMKSIDTTLMAMGFTASTIPASRQSGDKVFVNEKEYSKVQYDDLVARYKELGYEQLKESMAYTWFNRFIALRFMEANEYINEKIITSSTSKIEPDLVSSFRDASFYDNLSSTEKDYLLQLKDADNVETLYAKLVIYKCNELNKTLPFMFEKMGDYTELLFPSNLIAKGSFLENLREAIYREGEDPIDVEIIGNLYQYYNTEKKQNIDKELNSVTDRKVEKDDLPAKTQLFTPKWIVKYMVENSLGNLLLESTEGLNYDKLLDLKKDWKYYIDQEITKSELMPLEEIKLIDPCMGSGHILVYAFDFLYKVYEAFGYSERAIIRNILEKNLYGLEIDDRATQLAQFALMMKAREKYKGLLRHLKNDPIRLNIYAIQESKENVIDGFTRQAIGGNGLSTLNYLADKFNDAKELGSILTIKDFSLEKARAELEILKAKLGVNASQNALDRLEALVYQADNLARKYDVAITNPPYLNSADLSLNVLNYFKNNYKDSKGDFFAVFIERCIEFTNKNRYTAMITMHSWMFIDTYEKLRLKILNTQKLCSIVHLGPRAFVDISGEKVQTASWIMRNMATTSIITCHNLVKYKTAEEKESEFLSAKNIYSFSQTELLELPSYTFSYWIDEKIRKIFTNNKKLIEIAKPRTGMTTGKNERFLRLWSEINYLNSSYECNDFEEAINSKKKWFPYSKGGGNIKWYGLNTHLVNWFNNGNDIKNAVNSKGKKIASVRNEEFYFLEGITWSSVSSSNFSSRLVKKGFLFDSGGSSVFPTNNRFYILALLNSKITNLIIQAIAPTINFQPGDVGAIPINVNLNYIAKVNSLSESCIIIAKSEWDSRETSWDFKKSPLLDFGVSINSGLGNGEGTSIEIAKEGIMLLREKNSPKNIRIENAIEMWFSHAKEQFVQMHKNEEELNKIFIDIYGLADEMDETVDFKDITLYKDEFNIETLEDVLLDGLSETDLYLAERKTKINLNIQEIIKQFISYGVGCIMGRYSLDKEGLIIANSDDKLIVESRQLKVVGDMPLANPNTEPEIRHTISNPTFVPDIDGIIPIVDTEYFPDDIVTRFVEFVEKAFGFEYLDTNLLFIANALDKKDIETSKEAIRRYFLDKFMDDHIRRYKNRPIYWMFQSGDNTASDKKAKKDKSLKAFNCLVYLHRYHENTVGKIRQEYLLPYQARIQTELNRISEEMESASNKGQLQKEAQSLANKINEIKAYDENVKYFTEHKEKLDLDNGVAVNYKKLEKILYKEPKITKSKED